MYELARADLQLLRMFRLPWRCPTPHTPAAAAADAAAAAAADSHIVDSDGAWWCDATVLLMYYERVWFDEIEN